MLASRSLFAYITGIQSNITSIFTYKSGSVQMRIALPLFRALSVPRNASAPPAHSMPNPNPNHNSLQPYISGLLSYITSIFSYITGYVRRGMNSFRFVDYAHQSHTFPLAPWRLSSLLSRSLFPYITSILAHIPGLLSYIPGLFPYITGYVRRWNELVATFVFGGKFFLLCGAAHCC